MAGGAGEGLSDLDPFLHYHQVVALIVVLVRRGAVLRGRRERDSDTQTAQIGSSITGRRAAVARTHRLMEIAKGGRLLRAAGAQTPAQHRVASTQNHSGDKDMTLETFSRD